MPNPMDIESASDLTHPVDLGCVLGRAQLRSADRPSWFSTAFLFALTAWPQHQEVLNNIENETNKQKTPPSPLIKQECAPKGTYNLFERKQAY